MTSSQRMLRSPAPRTHGRSSCNCVSRNHDSQSCLKHSYLMSLISQAEMANVHTISGSTCGVFVYRGCDFNSGPSPAAYFEACIDYVLQRPLNDASFPTCMRHARPGSLFTVTCVHREHHHKARRLPDHKLLRWWDITLITYKHASTGITGYPVIRIQRREAVLFACHARVHQGHLPTQTDSTAS